MYSTLPRPPAPCPQAPALASPVSTLSRPIPRTFVLLTKCCRFIVIHQPVKFDSKSLNTQRNSKQYITHEPKHLSHNHIIKSFVTIRYVMYIYTTYTRSPSPRFYLLPLLPKKTLFCSNSTRQGGCGYMHSDRFTIGIFYYRSSGCEAPCSIIYKIFYLLLNSCTRRYSKRKYWKINIFEMTKEHQIIET